MICDHVDDYPEEYLVRLDSGAVVCPACARQCIICDTLVFHEHVNDEGLCPDCARTCCQCGVQYGSPDILDEHGYCEACNARLDDTQYEG